MKTILAAASLALFATGLPTTGGAQSLFEAGLGATGGGYASFGLMPSARQGRIHLDTSMINPQADPAQPARSGAAIGPLPEGGTALKIRHLIAAAEAGAKGYDAVQHGAAIRPPKPPTAMTIAEIYQWIAATPGQPHAIGRYQFIPNTLKSLVVEAGIGTGARFTPEVQDRLADILLEDAGYSALLAGRISRHSFMANLARIWAGLPTSTGKSYYHGYAGNRAVITWAEFDAHMQSILETGPEARLASNR